MSRFTSSILEHKQALNRRFDNLLRLKNVDSQTLDHDAHYAIFRLAQLVATEFPSADQELPWSREQLSYYLPPAWSTDSNPHWLVDCPTIVADYSEVLEAPGVSVVVGSSGSYLLVERTFRVDDLVCRTYIHGYMPAEDEALLRSLGKIIDAVEPSYTRTTINC